MASTGHRVHHGAASTASTAPAIERRATKLLDGAKVEPDVYKYTYVHTRLRDGAGHWIGHRVVRFFAHYPLAAVSPIAHPGTLLLRGVSHVTYTGGNKVQPDSIPPEKGGGKYTWIPLARLQSSRYEVTTYKDGTRYSTSVATGIGVPAKPFSLTGDITSTGTNSCEGQGGFSGAGKTRTITRRVDVTADRSAFLFRMKEFPMGVEVQQEELNAEWTSAIYAPYTGTWLDRFAQRHAETWTKGVDDVGTQGKSHGAALKATAGVDIPGIASIKISSTWGATFHQGYTFQWAKMRSGTTVCLGARAQKWWDAQYVAVSTQLP